MFDVQASSLVPCIVKDVCWHVSGSIHQLKLYTEQQIGVEF